MRDLERAINALAGWCYGHKPPLRPDWPERFSWLLQAGIVGFGLGTKDGFGPPCLSIEVLRKAPAHRLSRSELVPPRIVLEDGGVELETDVEEVAGECRIQSGGDLVRPLQPGAMAGIVDGDAGTIAVLVRSKDDPQILLLSCSHVLARSGQFGKNFGELSPSEKTILQPLDPSNAAAPVAVLIQGFTTLVAEHDGTNNADVAVAAVNPGIDLSPFQLKDGSLIQTDASLVPDAIRPGVPVTLLGAVTGPDSGIIRKTGATFVATHFPVLGSVRYTGMVQYDTLSLPGDSGGAVVDRNNCLLGIHVGRQENSKNGYFFPIDQFMRDSNFEVVTDIRGGAQ
jgi:Trypsin-like peptidase domain